MRYGNWTIEKEHPPIPTGPWFVATHDEYDGPEGMWPVFYSLSLDSVKAEIDEWEEEQTWN